MARKNIIPLFEEKIDECSDKEKGASLPATEEQRLREEIDEAKRIARLQVKHFIDITNDYIEMVETLPTFHYFKDSLDLDSLVEIARFFVLPIIEGDEIALEGVPDLPYGAYDEIRKELFKEIVKSIRQKK